MYNITARKDIKSEVNELKNKQNKSDGFINFSSIRSKQILNAVNNYENFLKQMWSTSFPAPIVSFLISGRRDVPMSEKIQNGLGTRLKCGQFTV